MIALTNLLTLAIAETRDISEYKVVVYNLDNNNIFALKIPETDFKDYKGNTKWDIFGVTQVREVYSSDGESEFYDYKGNPKVDTYYSKKEAKKFLNKLKFQLVYTMKAVSLKIAAGKFKKDYSGTKIRVSLIIDIHGDKST